jgi:rSAM/selenodomain-associated transferase 1
MHAACPNDSLAFRVRAGATLPAMRRALLIVGKPPEPGSTKTRLVPPLSPEDAAALYRGFLLDSTRMGLDLGWERVTVVHPRGGGQALADLLPPEICLMEQGGQGLSDALPSAFERHLAEGFLRVVLMSSDNPTLPLGLIEQACATLDTHDLSIGPSADGGYYLIGLREPHLGLFEGIDWSTSRVYSQTLAQADRLGLRVGSLQEWYDVDEPTDLERLQRELAASAESVAPYTRAALQRLAERPLLARRS